MDTDETQMGKVLILNLAVSKSLVGSVLSVFHL
jgi:hypothetical protein